MINMHVYTYRCRSELSLLQENYSLHCHIYVHCYICIGVMNNSHVSTTPSTPLPTLFSLQLCVELTEIWPQVWRLLTTEFVFFTPS